MLFYNNDFHISVGLSIGLLTDRFCQASYLLMVQFTQMMTTKETDLHKTRLEVLTHNNLIYFAYLLDNIALETKRCQCIN